MGRSKDARFENNQVRVCPSDIDNCISVECSNTEICFSRRTAAAVGRHLVYLSEKIKRKRKKKQA